jgi:hypothetical protein
MILIPHHVPIYVVSPANEAVLSGDTILLSRWVEHKFPRERRLDQQDRVDKGGLTARTCELEAATRDNPEPL